MRVIKDYRYTKAACYIGSVSQAAVCVFLPLLFVIFNEKYGISLAKLTFLITVNFVTQFITDCSSMLFADKVGYRKCIVAAHLFIAAGFAGLGLFSGMTDNIYPGLVLSVLLYSIGGGLSEVLISPILEGCPSDNKAASMSLLHSMFAFGSVLVILGTTAFFYIAGKEKWQIIAAVWALIPLLNAVYFGFVPICKTVDDEKRTSVSGLMKMKEFWLFILIMLCSGAAEQGMSQWASAFAESALGVSKAVGDVLGPCMFAVMMGIARILYPKICNKVSLTGYIMFCGVLCIASYLLAALSPLKLVALAGCGLCGFAVGIMWPGTISLAASTCPTGGTALFAAMALAGDIGCTSGPAVVGLVSSAFNNNLKTGLIAVIVFPALLILSVFVYKRHLRGNES